DLPGARHGAVEAAMPAEEGAQALALRRSPRLGQAVALEELLQPLAVEGALPERVQALEEEGRVAVGFGQEFPQDGLAGGVLELLGGTADGSPRDEAPEGGLSRPTPGARGNSFGRLVGGRRTLGACLRSGFRPGTPPHDGVDARRARPARASGRGADGFLGLRRAVEFDLQVD